MPDLSRFAALAAKSGVVPPCSTVPSRQVEQEFPCEINVVPPVPPVPSENDDAEREPPHPAACSTCNTVAPRNDVALHDDAAQAEAADPASDMEAYADALRQHGPASYGMMMRRMDWGGTRAGQAEAALRAAGRITFNELGRAILTH